MSGDKKVLLEVDGEMVAEWKDLGDVAELAEDAGKGADGIGELG